MGVGGGGCCVVVASDDHAAAAAASGTSAPQEPRVSANSGKNTATAVQEQSNNNCVSFTMHSQNNE